MQLVSSAALRLRALRYAEQIAPFAPRPRTVALITGLSFKEANRLFPSGKMRSGRCPAAQEWYHTGTLLEKIEASVFASLYWRNRQNRFPVVESLIDAYGRYRSVVKGGNCISFDRAVNLVGHLEPGKVFDVDERSFDLTTCTVCGSQFLIELSDGAATHSCIFCRFLRRFPFDPRLQAHFAASALPDLSNLVAFPR